METCRSELIQRSEQYGIVPKDLMMDRRISKSAKLVYAALATFGQTCFPSVKTLSNGIGMKPHTIHKALHELEQIDRITIERVRGQASVYHLH